MLRKELYAKVDSIIFDRRISGGFARFHRHRRNGHGNRENYLHHLSNFIPGVANYGIASKGVTGDGGSATARDKMS